MEDAEIVALYWQRDHAAVAETSRKYGRYCHAIAYNICGSTEDAEECVNDTWFRAWNLMPDKRPALLQPFLGRITRNFAINRLKAKNRIKRGGGTAVLALDELSECIPDVSNLEQTMETRELEAAIGRFVAGLSYAEKNVFVLRYWYLASIAEISERLSFSQSKTKSILFRVRKRLKAFLQEEDLC